MRNPVAVTPHVADLLNAIFLAIFAVMGVSLNKAMARRISVRCVVKNAVSVVFHVVSVANGVSGGFVHAVSAANEVNVVFVVVVNAANEENVGNLVFQYVANGETQVSAPTVNPAMTVIRTMHLIYVKNVWVVLLRYHAAVHQKHVARIV